MVVGACLVVSTSYVGRPAVLRVSCGVAVARCANAPAVFAVGVTGGTPCVGGPAVPGFGFVGGMPRVGLAVSGSRFIGGTPCVGAPAISGFGFVGGTLYVGGPTVCDVGFIGGVSRVGGPAVSGSGFVGGTQYVGLLEVFCVLRFVERGEGLDGLRGEVCGVLRVVRAVGVGASVEASSVVSIGIIDASAVGAGIRYAGIRGAGIHSAGVIAAGVGGVGVLRASFGGVGVGVGLRVRGRLEGIRRGGLSGRGSALAAGGTRWVGEVRVGRQVRGDVLDPLAVDPGAADPLAFHRGGFGRDAVVGGEGVEWGGRAGGLACVAGCGGVVVPGVRR